MSLREETTAAPDGPAGKSSPIVIAGMHRSGTSLIAGMLRQCGLYLGEPNEFIESRSDNPDGFWENERFLQVNEDILSELGGGWDCPPDKFTILPPLSDGLSRRIANLVSDFRSREFWGWKDPRNSLTLAIWKRFLAEFKV